MEGEATATGMQWLSGALDNVTTVFGSAVDLMTSNPLITVFLSVSVLSLGFYVFKKAKKTAR